LSIVDEHSRECLGGLVDRSITSDDLIAELDRLAVDRGYPAVLRCDNGPNSPAPQRPTGLANAPAWARSSAAGLSATPAQRALARRPAADRPRARPQNFRMRP
jgi:hypothetical protein